MAMARTIQRLREGMDGKPSPPKLAAVIGVKGQTWRNYENGIGPILSLDTQVQIAKALGITRQALLLEFDLELGVRPASIRTESAGLEDSRRGGFQGPTPEQVRRLAFPLGDGEALLTYPADISDDDINTLTEYLTTFTKNLPRSRS